MKTRFASYTWLAITAFVFMLVLLAGLPARAAVMAQAVQATPMPTADPTTTVLESMHATQQVQIDALSRDLDLYKKEQALNLRDLKSNLDNKLIIAGVIVFLAGFLGFNTYRSIQDELKKKMNATLSEALYRLDPSNLAIRLPPGMEMEERRLSVAGFKNLSTYQELDKSCYTGITIIKIDAEEDVEKFHTFIQRNQAFLDASRAGFVLFTPAVRISTDVVRSYANLGIANLSTQVVGAVMAVGRGLKPDEAPMPNSAKVD